MNSVQRSVALARVVASRQFCSEANVSSQFQRLKTNQSRFQTDDGVPVFLKGGAMDKILYQSTILLILVGSGMMGKLFWDLARK